MLYPGILLGLLIGWAWLCAPAAAAKLSEKKSKEYEIKSAFIYNFLKFIDWPKSKSEQSAGQNEADAPEAKDKVPPITIGFLGDADRFNACKVIDKKKVGGKQIHMVLLTIPSKQDLKDPKSSPVIQALQRCDVLFICTNRPGGSESPDLPMLLQPTRKQPILTIGEEANFLEQGGMLNFIVVENKIRFETNLDAAQQEGFQVKAQLLKLSTRVIKKEKPNP
ncbi:MAG: YfiR family protein [Sedimentisphaerales bacterium]|nr:YfiR family protein [Sedimentisphaerales bacterium]